MDISELLAFVVKNKASDLHLSSGLPPMIRVHGDVRRINLPAMEHKDVHAMVYDIMNDAQRKHYEEHLECDFSFAIPNLARFRVNAFVQQRGAGAGLGAALAQTSGRDGRQRCGKGPELDRRGLGAAFQKDGVRREIIYQKSGLR